VLSQHNGLNVAVNARIFTTAVAACPDSAATRPRALFEGGMCARTADHPNYTAVRCDHLLRDLDPDGARRTQGLTTVK
jgi:hypothetical protein